MYTFCGVFMKNNKLHKAEKNAKIETYDWIQGDFERVIQNILGANIGLVFKYYFDMKKSLALKLEKSEKSASKKKLTTRLNEPSNPLKNAKTSLRF